MVLDRLIELRKCKRWSLQYTADRLGIAKSTYAGYESGYREPSLEAIKLLADLFGTSVDFLLGRESVQPPSDPNKNICEPIELVGLESSRFAVDGKPLSRGELKHFIAFVRTLREMEGS
ncbi:helix-turn-helix domain-containing protein [Paenibacillus doosanensis]|uniref:HTH-type transcriptional regulator ImmR n=1 Tax=Paenibacillus konkukensis TaxID=2020716 RepID=A0ABY4RYI1_9BACL|nr:MULTISPECIES: helix-turn-helix domain-containing protein [Paenibacillus]MCS7463426.1 helix-turn-helix domain-containing protein [Paenibacillus doosanensis]UQZ87038.1 HTH-type transcriptional regulator ImmR [Paenibacillus konkukensis]